MGTHEITHSLSLHEPLLTSQDEEFVLDALRSGWVSTGGPYVDRFEQEFSAFVGSPYSVSVSNGTAGLILMVECLKRLRGIPGPFHVLVPNITFAATWNSVISAGGTPVLIDVAKNSMNMCPDGLAWSVEQFYRFDGVLKQWLHRKTNAPILAVMPAHIMGWTPPMEKIADFCKKTKITLLEDAAESLGCRNFDGSHVGLHGEASAFSFNGNKILTTGGGGMVVTANKELASLAKHLSTTAKTDGLRYVHDQHGFNFRLVNILAALGCSQLRNFEAVLDKKKAITKSYGSLLKELPSVYLHKEDHCQSNNWINNLIFSDEATRETALNRLLKNSIQCRPLWTPGHRLEYIKELQIDMSLMTESDLIWRRSLSLPSSPHLVPADMERVVSVVKSALQT